MELHVAPAELSDCNLTAVLFVQPPERQIMVGICCMMKKSKSKPMTQILERLCRFEYITVVIFPEDIILNEPVDKWPLCDCLISFHSKGNFLLSDTSSADLVDLCRPGFSFICVLFMHESAPLLLFPRPVFHWRGA